jgi:hypothetical protein
MSRLIPLGHGQFLRVGKPTPQELHEFYQRTDTPVAFTTDATSRRSSSAHGPDQSSGSGTPASKARRKPSKPSRA